MAGCVSARLRDEAIIPETSDLFRGALPGVSSGYV